VGLAYAGRSSDVALLMPTPAGSWAGGPAPTMTTSIVLDAVEHAEVASCSIKLVQTILAELSLAGCQTRVYRTTTGPDPNPRRCGPSVTQ